MEWLTPAETAAILKLHLCTIGELCRAGELPARKFGKKWRINKKALDAMGEAKEKPEPELKEAYPGQFKRMAILQRRKTG